MTLQSNSSRSERALHELEDTCGTFSRWRRFSICHSIFQCVPRPRPAAADRLGHHQYASERSPGMARRAGRGDRRLQVDAVVADRARWEPVVAAVERSLGRPCPCPPRVRPTEDASRLEVLAQRW